jgi:5-methylthioribose kinase
MQSGKRRNAPTQLPVCHRAGFMSKISAPTMNEADFHVCCPGVYFLDCTRLDDLGAYLTAGARLGPGETLLNAEKAGEGNMNCTVRVQTSAGSFILKQARPWVEKYPQLAAPTERALVEGRYYTAVADHPAVAGRMPRLLWIDAAARLLALEDLGAASDFFPIYAGKMSVSDQTRGELVAYGSNLHSIPLTQEQRRAFENPAMRLLNHEHVFALPLRAQNGLDLDALTPGLAKAAEPLKADADYQRIVRGLGERYKHEAGPSLLHGDFFPGSFLQTGRGLRVIDPEFCFCGDVEFDLGVLMAHLFLAGEPSARAESIFGQYRPAHRYSVEMTRQYAGVEIMRRLLGVAQLPTLAADLAKKTHWLELSRRLVLEPGKAAELP